MKYWVLGCGRIGIAAIYYLLNDDQTTAVTITDASVAALRSAADKLLRAGVAKDRIDAVATFLPMEGVSGLAEKLEPGAVVLSCLPYSLNPLAAKAAVESKCHFADLGGNIEATAEVLALSPLAKAAGVTLVPDCGLAPGLAGVVAMNGLPFFDEVEWIKLRCGGLPQSPEGPFKYSLVFSPEGLVNEYVEPALALRNGVVKQLTPMGELEEIPFSPPWGHLEAFTTSGGTSTLPTTLRGRVKNLDYKTIRYPGHCEKVRTLLDCGLADRNLWQLPGGALKPRELLEEIFRRTCPHDQPDVVLLRVELKGTKNGHEQKVTYEMIDTFDRKTGFSAMQRTTAYPLAIIGKFLANGTITERGAIHQEIVVPSDKLFHELAIMGVQITSNLRPSSDENA
ncbi:MAG: saccharopine dehydrogenase NADP-binding domain-containing protein [bacterium]|nr:saccharopine dehydrogenase NADP-binding domain-containing protein [bacterium]